jgi:signal transduction histidine kinase
MALSLYFGNGARGIWSFTIAAILLLSYTYSFPLGKLLALVGFFAGIRSRSIRQDAHRISQLHLQELNETHRELQEVHAELQEATVHSMRYAALEERTRLAREIHDGLGHQLTSLIVQLQALEIMLPDDPQGHRRRLHNCFTYLDRQ